VLTTAKVEHPTGFFAVNRNECHGVTDHSAERQVKAFAEGDELLYHSMREAPHNSLR
jgi:hypothetical protein